MTLLEEEIVRKYGKTCWEISFCIGIMETTEDQTLQELVENLEHVFLCEWDCTIKEWYENYV